MGVLIKNGERSGGGGGAWVGGGVCVCVGGWVVGVLIGITSICSVVIAQVPCLLQHLRFDSRSFLCDSYECNFRRRESRTERK